MLDLVPQADRASPSRRPRGAVQRNAPTVKGLSPSSTGERRVGQRGGNLMKETGFRVCARAQQEAEEISIYSRGGDGGERRPP